MHGVDDRLQVDDGAADAWVLQEHGETGRRAGIRGAAGHDLDAQRRRARADHLERLRQDVGGDEERGHRIRGARVPGRPADAQGQRHRLGRRSCLVEHRRARDVHAGQVADHRLKVDQGL
jgi:hypothetical protein